MAEVSARAPAKKPEPRRIWLCADDYGISPAVDTAIRNLIVRGRLNATSVMVVAPAFQRSEAKSLAILNAVEKRAAIGLHLTLTAPFAPLSKGYAPASNGSFLPLRATLGEAMRRRLHPERLRGEMLAQLRAFERAFDRLPDYIDGHQHVHLFPQVREAVLQIVKEHVPGAWVRQCGRVTPWYRRLGDGKGLLLDFLSAIFRRRAGQLGVPTNPAFAGTYSFNPRADFATLFPRFLADLPEGSVVMCHPGFVDAELKRVDPLTDLREREYAFLAGDSFPALLAAQGVTLA